MKNRFDVEEIPRVETLSKQAFITNYLKPQKPVVIEGLAEDWPAFEKWSLDYMDKVAGDKTVPLFDDRPISSKYKFNEPHTEMKMSEYVRLLKSGPTNYRIFLYNLLKEIPALQQDFKYPDLGLRFLKKLPFLFFGGQDAKVFMHYDIDYANFLHIHFEGEKNCLLFPPSETKYLYKVPFALIARQDIDFSNPDFKKWPALKKAKGLSTNLKHGDILFVPEGYWHFMHYKTAGFSMSLRAAPRTAKNFLKACNNLVFMRYFDNFMREVQGQKWIDYKNKLAIKRTNANLRK